MSQGDTAITSARSADSLSSGDVLQDMIRRGHSFSGRERNCCFLNLGDGHFADISAVSGFDFPDDGRAVARVDWDHDGDLDFWIVNRSGPQLRLLRNDVSSKHHWLALRLVGNGTTCNRDAIGARVEVHVAGQQTPAPILATLRAGDGFLAQSSKWLHFGLANADKIERVTVRWPDGNVEQLAGLAPDKRYRIVQGSGIAEPLQSSARADIDLQPAPLETPPPPQTAQVLSVAALPMPPIDYETYSGEPRRINVDSTEQPLLVNLWASWCQPCLRELKDLALAEERLRQAGLDVVALSVDGLEGEQSSSAEAAQQWIANIGFRFRSGQALASTVHKLQLVHDHLFDLHLPLAVPTSVLLDSQRRVAAFYRGPLNVDRLIQNVAQLRGDQADKLLTSLPFPGKWQGHRAGLNPFDFAWDLLDHGFLRDGIRYFELNRHRLYSKTNVADLFFKIADEQVKADDNRSAEKNYRAGLAMRPNSALDYYNLGLILQAGGRPIDAAREYRRALDFDKDLVKARTKLAVLLASQGQIKEALRHFRRVAELDPDSAPAHVNLGVALSKLQDAEAAIRHFRLALELQPSNVTAHANLGNALLAQDQTEAAVRHLRRAVELNPNYGKAHHNLGIALRKLGQNEESTRHLQKAQRLGLGNSAPP